MADFLVLDGSSFWDATRLAALLLAVVNLGLMIEGALQVWRDTCKMWIFAGLASFNVLIVAQALQAWGEDVLLWRVLLGWAGLVYTLRALLQGRNHGTVGDC